MINSNNENNLFYYPNSYSNFNTQLEALKCITDNTMRELFKNLVNKFITQEIIQDIQQYRNKYKQLDQNNTIISEYNVTNNKSNLFIFYKKPNKDLYHFTIHLCPEYLNTSTNGLIHIKEDNKHSQQIFVAQQNEGLPYFKLGSSMQNGVDANIQLEGHIICKVLNKYMNVKHKKFLTFNRNPQLGKLNTNFAKVKQRVVLFQSKTRSQQKVKPQRQTRKVKKT